MGAAVEIVLAFLAAIGLLGLGWLLFGRALTPAGGAGSLAVVPGSGDGDNLEQTVMGLLWLRGGGLFQGSIVIADCGLSKEGQAVAAALTVREPNLILCPCERLEELVRKA